MFRGIGNDDAKQFNRQLHQTGIIDSVDNWLPSKGLKSEILTTSSSVQSSKPYSRSQIEMLLWLNGSWI